MREEFFKQARRLVIKIGTTVVADHDDFNEARIRHLAGQIAEIRGLRPNLEIVLVSSGAIGAGMRVLGIRRRPGQIERLQAMAAVGQRRLMQAYDGAFQASGILTAQLLLTWEDLGSRKRYQNTRRTLEELMRYRVVPVINENDTVSTEEIQFGDNDQLSSMVALLFDADILIILSDADGLYADYQAGHRSRIPCVDDLNASIFEKARDGRRALSKGGMKSKLAAIQKVVATGTPCVLANGREDGVLTRLFAGEDTGTLFLPKIKKTSSKKHWIAYVSRPEGTLVIDRGAAEALLKRGKSLLAKGIVRAQGHFEPASAVVVQDEEGRSLGKGIVNFSSAELDKIRGANSKDWNRILGRPCMDEVLHRDNFVKERHG